MLEERSSDVYTNYLESHTVRYNTLRHEAFKFVDGAKSSETYDIALDALKEAAKKVALATKNDGKAMVNGHVRGNLAGGASRSHYASGNHEGSSGQHLSEVRVISQYFLLLDYFLALLFFFLL